MVDVARAYAGFDGNPEWPAYKWRVTLCHVASGRTFATDYRCGVGHASREKPSAAGDKVWERARLELFPVECARALRRPGRLCMDDCQGDFYIIAPSPSDVLSSLQRDANAPEFFEDFASEFGYDVDSRKAEATHRACRESRAALAKLLGPDFDAFMATDWEARS